jgi:hypothetical protein
VNRDVTDERGYELQTQPRGVGDGEVEVSTLCSLWDHDILVSIHTDDGPGEFEFQYNGIEVEV